MQGGSDLNDNDVSLSPPEEGGQDDNAIDTVEIHVVGETSVQTEENLEERNETEIVNCLDGCANNENEASLSESNHEHFNTNHEHTILAKLALAEENKESSRQNKTMKEVKQKHFTKKSKAKHLKKSMQIFTVLEEEISSIDNTETPRT